MQRLAVAGVEVRPPPLADALPGSVGWALHQLGTDGTLLFGRGALVDEGMMLVRLRIIVAAVLDGGAPDVAALETAVAAAGGHIVDTADGARVFGIAERRGAGEDNIAMLLPNSLMNAFED